MGTLQHVVDNLDPTLAEAHLLMAQIQLHQVNHLIWNKFQIMMKCGLNISRDEKM